MGVAVMLRCHPAVLWSNQFHTCNVALLCNGRECLFSLSASLVLLGVGWGGAVNGNVMSNTA